MLRTRRYPARYRSPGGPDPAIKGAHRARRHRPTQFNFHSTSYWTPMLFGPHASRMKVAGRQVASNGRPRCYSSRIPLLLLSHKSMPELSTGLLEPAEGVVANRLCRYLRLLQTDGREQRGVVPIFSLDFIEMNRKPNIGSRRL